MSLIKTLTDRIRRSTETHRRQRDADAQDSGSQRRQALTDDALTEHMPGITETWRRRQSTTAKHRAAQAEAQSKIYEPHDAHDEQAVSPSEAALEAVSQDVILGYLVLRLWSAFFHSFAEDEHNFERSRYMEEAAVVNKAVMKLRNRTPDLELCCDMLSLLVKWQEERAEDTQTRVYELKRQAAEYQRKLQAGELSSCVQTDEINRIREELSAFYLERNMALDFEALPPSQVVHMLINEVRQGLAHQHSGETAEDDTAQRERKRTGFKLFNWRPRTGN